MDKINTIATEIFDLLELETETDGMFEGFEIYREYKQTEPLFFPCIIMTCQPLGLSDVFFGGGGIGTVNVLLDLAFKEKAGLVSLDADKYSTETLINLYEARLKLFYEKLAFTSAVSIADMSYKSEQHFPLDKSQELYGVSFAITIGYLDEGTEEEENVL